MTGLEAIISQITGDAQKEAAEHLESARVQAEKLLAAAKEEAAAKSKAILDDGEKQAQDIRARAASAAQLDKRNRTLSVKQEIIQETITSVRRELENAPDESYFKMLLSLAARFAQTGEGVLHLNQKDLSRLPASFEKDLSTAAPHTAITVSKEPVAIESGFLLTYGGIDVNCTLKAVFEDAGDALRDAVGKILFQHA